MIKDYLILDNSFHLVDNACRYCKEQGLNIWEPDNGYARSTEMSEDNLNYQLVAIMDNYSKLRYNQIKRTINAVYGEKETNESYIYAF